MALQLQVEFKGLTANYWKTVAWAVDTVTAKTTTEVALYFSKATRDASVSNVLDKLTIQIAGVPDTEDDRDWLYTKLKAGGQGVRQLTRGPYTPDFTTAIDV